MTAVPKNDRRKPPAFDVALQTLLDKLEADAAPPLVAGIDEAAVARHRLDGVLWAEEALGIPQWYFRWSQLPQYADHKWDGSVDPLAQMFDGLAENVDVGVESAVGTGKTVGLAIVAMWFLACWEGAQVITAAPKEAQLVQNMWRWMGHFFERFKRRYPKAELGKLALHMNPPGPTYSAWTAIGFVAGVGADEEVATKAAGFHAVDQLIICEETPGIKQPVMNAFAQTSVAPHNRRLAVGNPDNQHDALHQFCQEPGVRAVRISALDHPNVVCQNDLLIAGAVTRPDIAKKLTKYGEASTFYRSRVRGISPPEARDAMIKLEWLHKARDRGFRLMEALKIDSLEQLMDLAAPYAVPNNLDGPLAMGLDVANSRDGDEACEVWGRGRICCMIRSDPCPNSNLKGMAVGLEAKLLQLDGDYIGVDGVGVGAGAVNELMGMGLIVQNFAGNASPDADWEGEEKFHNIRAQQHYKAREDLRFGRLILPDDPELFEDLTIPQMLTRAGKILVAPKEEFKKKLGRSPNRGDAFIYWNWVREIRGGATIGGSLISF